MDENNLNLILPKWCGEETFRIWYRTTYLYITSFPKPTPPHQEAFQGIKTYFHQFVVDEIYGLQWFWTSIKHRLGAI